MAKWPTSWTLYISQERFISCNIERNAADSANIFFVLLSSFVRRELCKAKTMGEARAQLIRKVSQLLHARVFIR